MALESSNLANRVLQLEANYTHTKESLQEIKGDVKDLREEIMKLGNIISEKRGAVNMRRTILYGVSSLVTIFTALGLHEYILKR